MTRPGTSTLAVPAGPFPTSSRYRFVPPSEDSRPLDLFRLAIGHYTIPAPRFTRIDNPYEMLIFADGASAGNGTPEARGGCGIVFRDKNNVSLRLELDGQPQTSNRAELRAVVQALGFRGWKWEGFTKVVIASDSEYVVLGVCERLPKWRRNGWKTAAGKPVANRDLWERLVVLLEDWDKYGLAVQFWRISRELNTEADALAKNGTTLDYAPTVFSKLTTLGGSDTFYLIQDPPSP